jgi:hypothetical protein
MIGDSNSVSAQCPQQASLAQRCGTLFDARPVGGNARRHTHQPPRPGAGLFITRHCHSISSGTDRLTTSNGPLPRRVGHNRPSEPSACGLRQYTTGCLVAGTACSVWAMADVA